MCISEAHPNWTFSFEVKFYPLDAAGLREDYTRCDECISSVVVYDRRFAA